MKWNEIFQWSQIGFIACCALVLQLTLSLAVRLEAVHAAPSHAAPGPIDHLPAIHSSPPAKRL
jgi:hypothetical protein